MYLVWFKSCLSARRDDKNNDQFLLDILKDSKSLIDVQQNISSEIDQIDKSAPSEKLKKLKKLKVELDEKMSVASDSNNLYKLIKSEVNTFRGIRDEEEAINSVVRETSRQVVGADGYRSKIYYKTFRFTHQKIKYSIKIGGRVDGIFACARSKSSKSLMSDDFRIVEVKNRQRKLFRHVPLYEQIQVQTYFQLTGSESCFFLEKFGEETWSTVIWKDQDFWDQKILPGLKNFCIKISTWEVDRVKLRKQ